MNCIIIEDGYDAGEYLEHQIRETSRDVEVIAKISSVKEAVQWLKHHQTDLIFLDIQLTDGLSFDIFDHVQVNAPVIITTSFDQYAIKAFELNSLSYLLKPVSTESLKIALDKYKYFYPRDFSIGQKVIPLQQNYQQRFFVESGNTIQSIAASEVSYFTIHNGRNLVVFTRDGQQFLYDNTLERLELRLDPAKFFRINRQSIINIDSIHKMINYDSRRIKIETDPESKDELVVAMTKTQAFKEWLNL